VEGIANRVNVEDLRNWTEFERWHEELAGFVRSKAESYVCRGCSEVGLELEQTHSTVVSPLSAQTAPAAEYDRPLTATAADIGEMQMNECDQWIHQKSALTPQVGDGAAQNDCG
jgi:hypothetical protein